MSKINEKIFKVEKIADYFIWKSNSEDKIITNKKLQKLLYYSQAWNLVLKNKALFNEKIEAWIHGPAIRKIYLLNKKFGCNPIIKKVRKKELDIISNKTKSVLDEIWKIYGKFDADYLEFLTHSEKPWQDARADLLSHEASENEISHKDMKAFYSMKLEQCKTI